MKSSIILFLIILLGNVIVFAQDGSPDPTFGGGDGLFYHSIFAGKPSQGWGIAIQPDHKILVAGSTLGPDGRGHAFLSRYHEDGGLDNSFNGSGILLPEVPGVNSYSSGVKVQPDGKIVLCTVSSDSTSRYVTALRFTEEGLPDNTFDGDGQFSAIIESDYMDISTMVLQPDGKILIGGYAGAFEADSFMVVRILSNGGLDQSFAGGGILITGVGEDYTDVNSLLVQSDGKILATGYATFNGNEDFTVVRYNSNGTLDNSFSGDGIAHVTISDHDDRVYSSLLQPDSKIVIAGYAYNTITGKESFAAARLNPDGTLDNNFHGDGIALIYITDYYDRVFSIIRQPDGKFILAGNVRAGAPDYGFTMGIARITENGVLDYTFDGDGVYILPPSDTIESEIHAAALQSDGKIVFTGNYRVNPLNQVMVYRAQTGLTTAINNVDQFTAEVSIYPNPMSDNVVLIYSLEKTESLRITLCDAMGRTVVQLLDKVQRSPGNHEEHLKLGYLAPGNYFVKLETESGMKTMLLIKE